MRILLVNPWIHDFSAYDLWIQPLGLLYLAGVLEQNHFDISYIDCLNNRCQERTDGRSKFRKQQIPTPPALRNTRRRYGRYGLSVEDFHQRLVQIAPPDAILVTSGMTYWYPGLQETIRELRQDFPETKIIVGGIYATLMPEHAKKHSGADVVVSGQFENGIVDLLRQGEPAARPYRSIDEYPYPAWHLTNATRYRILLTSRGCPYRCTFCASDVLNNQRFLQRKPELVFEEIHRYYFDEQIREFVFYDDALLINHRSHLEPLLKEIIAQNIHAHFHTPNGLNAREIDAPLAELMFEAGFRTIRLSLESVNAEIQKRKGNRKVDNQQFQNAVENLYRAGYKPGDLECYLIMGLPEQKLESIRDSLRFVADLGVVARLATYSPIPGTREAEDAQRFIGDEFLREPLLQNQSCFALKNTGITEADLQFVKQECTFHNDMIRKVQVVI